MLPESLDPSALRTVALGGMGVLVILAFLVMRMVQKMVLKVVFIGVIAGVGLYLWSERAQLDDCRTTCEPCSLAGFDVQVPGCPDPD